MISRNVSMLTLAALLLPACFAIGIWSGPELTYRWTMWHRDRMPAFTKEQQQEAESRCGHSFTADMNSEGRYVAIVCARDGTWFRPRDEIITGLLAPTEKPVKPAPPAPQRKQKSAPAAGERPILVGDEAAHVGEHFTSYSPISTTKDGVFTFAPACWRVTKVDRGYITGWERVECEQSPSPSENGEG